VYTARPLLWFYVRPALHAALVDRAARRGRNLEHEIIDILEAATRRPARRRLAARNRLRLLRLDEDGPRAS
jgi:hypothetical protein